MIKDRYTSERLELEILPRAIELVPKVKRIVAIDGGANIGKWTEVLAPHFVLVHAFEPVRFSYDDMAARLKQAGIENVTLHHKALMQNPMRVAMKSPLKRSASTAMYAMQSPLGNVEATTFADMVELGLVKLDLEGAELRALKGGERAINAWHPVLIIESVKNQLRRYGDTPEDLERWLVEHGYQAKYRQSPNTIWVHQC